MSQNAINRKEVISSLLPAQSEQLLDVGCGPLYPDYPYANKAEYATCVDWKLERIDPLPPNVQSIGGDFTQLDLPSNFYNTIISADVFEHIQIEQESAFIERCLYLLKDGDHLIISVPHRGTFAWLDPYEIKPLVQRLLWHLGLYKSLHNGYCDIRKGHKHYQLAEIAERFKPLEVVEVKYWGYFFDPVLSWLLSLSGDANFPGRPWIERACSREFEQDYGHHSFNMALKFQKV
jgi:ubiquinone/menaquinone biosynthesis C-methylase UbiE